MVAAVIESHRLGARVAFPLAGRRNPYEVFAAADAAPQA
jgi:hypothetical protein